MHYKFLVSLAAFFCSLLAQAQKCPTTLADSSFQKRFLHCVDKKVIQLQSGYDRQNEKYLLKILKRERKLRKEIASKDSLLAKDLFGDLEESYAFLKRMPAGTKNPLTYSGHLDSLISTLKFFDNYGANEKINKSLASLADVQEKLNDATRLKKYVLQRQAYLEQRLKDLPSLRQFGKLKKEMYYYKAQLDQLRQTFEDPQKAETALLSKICQTPAFKKFFASNSQIGRFFRISNDGSGSSVSLDGLQTRASVQQTVESRTGSGPSQFVETQLAKANDAAASIKQSADLPQLRLKMPGSSFKPNTQKTKPFSGRLEKGVNVHFGKMYSFMPLTADIALSIGYRLNDGATIGAGASYTLGLGHGISDISLSHQGYTLRSFIDWKLRGSIYLSGGYERRFVNMPDGHDLKNWQQSGLLGLSKKWQLNNKINGKMQLLFDLLSQHAQPVSEPVIFRVGYNF